MIKKIIKIKMMKIKSKYIIKQIFQNIKQNQYLELIKYNKKIQNKLDKSLEDYKEYSRIEIDLRPITNYAGDNKFINLNDNEKQYIHIYFNNNKKERKSCILQAKPKIQKIKIKLDYEIKSLKGLFKNCQCLEEINFIKFNRKDIIDMSEMFNDCKNLNKINLLNMNTGKVNNMRYMFCGCSSLKEINLLNFNTANVINMQNMFDGCESLKALDFPNLDLTSVTNEESLKDIFLNCKKLEYINIKNLISPENKIKNGFFDGTQNNLIICIDHDKEHLINDAIISNCTIINCLEDFTNHTYKINTENGCFVEDCILTNYKYEYNYKCYPKCLISTYNNNYTCENCHSDCEECYGKYTDNNTNCISCISKEKYLNYGNCINNCSRGFYINKTNNQSTCKCEIEQCLTCSMESLNRGLCTLCDEESGFYPIYDLNSEYYPYLNCSTLLEGYYFDYENLTFKLCYLTCKSCNISGNETEHNCIECKNGYNYEENFELYKNCYYNCSYYYYFDENNNKSICTSNYKCPNNYDKLIEDK